MYFLLRYQYFWSQLSFQSFSLDGCAREKDPENKRGKRKGEKNQVIIDPGVYWLARFLLAFFFWRFRSTLSQKEIGLVLITLRKDRKRRLQVQVRIKSNVISSRLEGRTRRRRNQHVGDRVRSRGAVCDVICRNNRIRAHGYVQLSIVLTI